MSYHYSSEEDFGEREDSEEEVEDSGSDRDERFISPGIRSTRAASQYAGQYMMSGAIQPRERPSEGPRGEPLREDPAIPSALVEQQIEEGEVPISRTTAATEGELRSTVREPPVLDIQPPDYDTLSTRELMELLDSVNEVGRPSEIVEGLYISNLETASAYLTGARAQELPRNKPRIKYVLSIFDYYEWDDRHIAIKPKPPGNIRPDNHMKLNAKDSKKIRFYEWFPKICMFIRDSLQNQDGGVLVHCRKGISRSVTAVMAYLIWLHRMDAVSAFNHVQEKRRVAWPNNAFQRQLQLWERQKCRIVSTNGTELEAWWEHTWNENNGLNPAVIFDREVEDGPEMLEYQEEMGDIEEQLGLDRRGLPGRGG